MDVQKGLYAVDEADQPLSAWQVLQDPTVFERQDGCRRCRSNHVTATPPRAA